MSRHLIVALALLIAAVAPLAAFAADMEGKVQSVDTGERTTGRGRGSQRRRSMM